MKVTGLVRSGASKDEEMILFMKVFELGYPFLWKGRKSLAC